MPTAGIRQRYPLKCNGPGYRLVGGRFAGINGAAPTTIFGDGFTIARSGEGVWVVTLAKPLANFVAVKAWGTDNDGNHHDLQYTLSASGRTITITHKTSTFAVLDTSQRVEGVSVLLDDVSTASSAYVASPINGTVTRIRTVLYGAISGTNAVLTARVNGGTLMGSSAVTITASGSAAGDRDSSTPNSNNSVSEGDAIEIITDGASTDTAKVMVTFLITPTAAAGIAVEDVIDEIGFMALVAESDVIGAGV